MTGSLVHSLRARAHQEQRVTWKEAAISWRGSGWGALGGQVGVLRQVLGAEEEEEDRVHCFPIWPSSENKDVSLVAA